MTILLQILTDGAIVAASDSKIVHVGTPAAVGPPMPKMIRVSEGRILVASCGPGRMEFQHRASEALDLTAVSYRYDFSVLMRGRSWGSTPKQVATELASAADQTFGDLAAQMDWQVRGLVAGATAGAPLLVRYIVMGYDRKARPALLQVEVPLSSETRIGRAHVSRVLRKPFPAERLAVECSTGAADRVINDVSSLESRTFRRRAPELFRKLMADRSLTVAQAKRAAALFIGLQARATPQSVDDSAVIEVIAKPRRRH